ncbi:MAG: DUF4013 domain-containing protein [Calditrichaeota bacterium]|nr:MAG: DUF4013 domain-containing protein [Calditrichota bacterium]
MNYSEALSFTFEDSQWVKKIAIGGLIALVSFCLLFMFAFILVGYYVGVLRNVLKREAEPLPAWSDMGKIVVDGVLGTVISFIYFVLIGGVCALLIVQVTSQPFMQETERVVLIVLISVSTLLALGVFINFGLMQYAATQNFGAAFNVSDLHSLLKGHMGDYIAILVFSCILNALLFLAGFGIISPFTNFWGMVVQAHLFGQCARALYPVQPSVQSASA